MGKARTTAAAPMNQKLRMFSENGLEGFAADSPRFIRSFLVGHDNRKLNIVRVCLTFSSSVAIFQSCLTCFLEKLSTNAISPFHSNFDCFRFSSHQKHLTALG